MTDPKTPFFGTIRDLLMIFGLAIKAVMTRPPHHLKTRKGCSAKGPRGRHRGAEFRGYRRAAAHGPNSYAEHDRLVSEFGAKSIYRFERYSNGKCSPPDRLAEINGFMTREFLS